MKIKPLYDRVVLRPSKNSEKTQGGIMLPEIAQEKSQTGEVVAIGNGKNFEGKTGEMQVKIGDKVLFSKFSGTEIKIDGEDFIIVREPDILAVLGGEN